MKKGQKASATAKSLSQFSGVQIEVKSQKAIKGGNGTEAPPIIIHEDVVDG